MRIGIDARNLVPKLSGIGRYVVETSRHLAKLGHEVILYIPERPCSEDLIPPDVTSNISQFCGALPRIWWGNMHLPKLVQRDEIDVLWGPAHRLPLVGCANIAQILTIHDLVWHHASDTMRTRGWIGERMFMKQSILKADRIIAVSSSTQDAVSVLYPWAKDKIDVVYPGCTPLERDSAATILERKNITRPFALFVGTLEPRKNLNRILRAFALLPECLRNELDLVIAGGQGWGIKDLESEISRLKLTSTVHLTGFVSDDELGTLYHSAKFLVMPSLYEGFGLPIIEANSAGIPVLTSHSSSMPEVGGDAALLVDPTSDEAIAAGLARLATDGPLYQRLSASARSNAARFNWTTSAERLSIVFEETLDKRK
jgi:glycosyltransferase involved in cell wall biosynthesis